MFTLGVDFGTNSVRALGPQAGTVGRVPDLEAVEGGASVANKGVSISQVFKASLPTDGWMKRRF